MGNTFSYWIILEINVCVGLSRILCYQRAQLSNWRCYTMMKIYVYIGFKIEGEDNILASATRLSELTPSITRGIYPIPSMNEFMGIWRFGGE